MSVSHREMPRCQGPPGEPCLDSCSDHTVRFGFYDVYLCPACEHVRDEIEQRTSITVKGASTASTTSTINNGKVKSINRGKAKIVVEPSAVKPVDETGSLSTNTQDKRAYSNRSTRSSASDQRLNMHAW